MSSQIFVSSSLCILSRFFLFFGISHIISRLIEPSIHAGALCSLMCLMLGMIFVDLQSIIRMKYFLFEILVVAVFVYELVRYDLQYWIIALLGVSLHFSNFIEALFGENLLPDVFLYSYDDPLLLEVLGAFIIVSELTLLLFCPFCCAVMFGEPLVLFVKMLTNGKLPFLFLGKSSLFDIDNVFLFLDFFYS